LTRCGSIVAPLSLLRQFLKALFFLPQDCEPIWLERDNAVKNLCASHKELVLNIIIKTGIKSNFIAF
jgi:hypothetical protein